MSRKGKRKSRKSDFPLNTLQQNQSQLYKSSIKHNKPKLRKQSKSSKSPSLSSAKVHFGISTPKRPTPPKTDASEGNLLQRFKHYQNYKLLPTNREIAWDNFLVGLNDLPDELKIHFTEEIDYLRQKYGDELVAYYLDKKELLGEISKFSSINYKSVMAGIYLYKLARGIEMAKYGELSFSHEDLLSQAEWSISMVVKPENRAYYANMLTDESIRDTNLEILLDEFFDSMTEEMD